MMRIANCCVRNFSKLLSTCSGRLSSRAMSDQSADMEPPAKKAKTDDKNGSEVVIGDLSEFQFVRMLGDRGQKKVICVEGTLKGKEGKAILWLEKTAFSEDVVKALCTQESKLVSIFNNDLYGSYSAFVDPKLNEIKTTLVYPATEKHIQAALRKKLYVVEETPDCYNSITLPFIQKEQFTVDWVYNILDGKKEVGRIIYEDKDPEIGFTLIPDLKWNAKQTEDLYCLALVRPRGIKSLRDLTDKHLPLLNNVLNKGREAIKDKFNIGKDRLRIYLHYQPSFYHLHVHFNLLDYDAPGIHCEKAYLLNTVIHNLTLYPNYYQNATLTCIVSDSQNLCKELLKTGFINQS